MKANTYAAQPVDLSFYHTSDGKKIDFVLDNGKGLVLLEVKAAHSVTPADFRHISYFIGQNPGRVVQGFEAATTKPTQTSPIFVILEKL